MGSIPPKKIHHHCFHFLLGITVVPREIEDNAYAILWGVKKVYYGQCESDKVNLRYTSGEYGQVAEKGHRLLFLFATSFFKFTTLFFFLYWPLRFNFSDFRFYSRLHFSFVTSLLSKSRLRSLFIQATFSSFASYLFLSRLTFFICDFFFKSRIKKLRTKKKKPRIVKKQRSHK